MKFKNYIEEGKEAKFIRAIDKSVSMSQVRRYKELAFEMNMSDKERKKIKNALEKKLKEMSKKKK